MDNPYRADYDKWLLTGDRENIWIVSLFHDYARALQKIEDLTEELKDARN